MVALTMYRIMNSRVAYCNQFYKYAINHAQAAFKSKLQITFRNFMTSSEILMESSNKPHQKHFHLNATVSEWPQANVKNGPIFYIDDSRVSNCCIAKEFSVIND